MPNSTTSPVSSVCLDRWRAIVSHELSSGAFPECEAGMRRALKLVELDTWATLALATLWRDGCGAAVSASVNRRAEEEGLRRAATLLSDQIELDLSRSKRETSKTSAIIGAERKPTVDWLRASARVNRNSGFIGTRNMAAKLEQLANFVECGDMSAIEDVLTYGLHPKTEGV